MCAEKTVLPRIGFALTLIYKYRFNISLVYIGSTFNMYWFNIYIVLHQHLGGTHLGGTHMC